MITLIGYIDVVESLFSSW